MIQFFRVYKQYRPPSYALWDINIFIDKGEFVFITGPSGAGKTTFLKLILREEFPTAGNIVVNGRNIKEIPDSKIHYLRREIGLVFQDFHLITQWNIFDNVAITLRVLGFPEKEIRKKVLKILSVLGLYHRVWRYPLELSAGEQQRVAIARAIVNNPLILLADEPTGDLDPMLTREIMEIFKNINAQGTTVVVATHNIDLIKEMRKRTVYLENGKLVNEEKY
ncbi:MAG: cell division ATP-binding protein FtsE [Candidatus Aminicenantia bacterium]